MNMCVHVCEHVCFHSWVSTSIGVAVEESRGSLESRPLEKRNRLCQGHIHSWPESQNIGKEGAPHPLLFEKCLAASRYVPFESSHALGRKKRQ